MGLTDFVIIHLFIASFSPAQGDCNQMLNVKFTRTLMHKNPSSRKRYSQRLGEELFYKICVGRNSLKVGRFPGEIFDFESFYA